MKKNNAEKRDRLEFVGEVINACKGVFTVKINEEHIIMATLSGKIRLNGVKILVGDQVQIEATPYDPTKGRITYRLKQ